IVRRVLATAPNRSLERERSTFATGGGASARTAGRHGTADLLRDRRRRPGDAVYDALDCALHALYNPADRARDLTSDSARFLFHPVDRLAKVDAEGCLEPVVMLVAHLAIPRLLTAYVPARANLPA